jgi:uncharacterized protein (TIGR03435 family)
MPKTPALAAAVAAALLAQPPAAKFEVASVKDSAPNQRGYSIAPAGGGMKARNCPLSTVIQEAYAIQPFQLSAGPSWIRTARYDIDAKAGDAQAARGQLRAMLQSLLADRFQLAVHRETRELPVYSLTIAKGGPKLTPVPNPPAAHGVDFRNGGTLILGRAATMQELAEALSFRVERSVTDHTGLDGRYDFRIEFTPDEAVPRFGEEHAPLGDVDGSSLFTALQEQAGLRLESSRGPVPILVVDRVARPSAN